MPPNWPKDLTSELFISPNVPTGKDYNYLNECISRFVKLYKHLVKKDPKPQNSGFQNLILCVYFVIKQKKYTNK